jgi:drug/metabolite transporter (DMT)-like permease
VALGEGFPLAKHIVILLLLGFVAYGLSIYCYTYAQRTIGAARTSTYYALAPFIGAALSFLLLGEPLTPLFLRIYVLKSEGFALHFFHFFFPFFQSK